MTRAILIESKTPKHFWPEALATSAYLLNRLPTNILKLQTPLQVLSILKLQTPLQVLSTLTKVPQSLTLQPHIFGCSVLAHIPKYERTKLSPCAIKCVFVVYEVNQKGYRCFDPKSKRIFTTMNCDFLESEYFFAHLSCQGESNNRNNNNDLLSWMSMLSIPEVDLTEKVVSRTAEQVSEVKAKAVTNTSPDISPLLISDGSPPSLVNNDT